MHNSPKSLMTEVVVAWCTYLGNTTSTSSDTFLLLLPSSQQTPRPSGGRREWAALTVHGTRQGRDTPRFHLHDRRHNQVQPSFVSPRLLLSFGSSWHDHFFYPIPYLSPLCLNLSDRHACKGNPEVSLIMEAQDKKKPTNMMKGGAARATGYKPEGARSIPGWRSWLTKITILCEHIPAAFAHQALGVVWRKISFAHILCLIWLIRSLPKLDFPSFAHQPDNKTNFGLLAKHMWAQWLFLLHFSHLSLYFYPHFFKY